MGHTALQTVDRIKSSARAGSTPDTRVVTELPYGKVFRQGDVYIKRLPLEDMDRIATKTAHSSRQVVPDDDSVGSRHIVRDGSARLFVAKETGPLTGPVIEAPEGFYLEHPKHGDFDIRLPGCYEVTFPRDMTQEVISRLRD